MFALTHSDLQARKLLSPGTHYAAGANIDAAVMTLSLKLHKDDATKGQVSCANVVLSQALMYEDDLIEVSFRTTKLARVVRVRKS